MEKRMKRQVLHRIWNNFKYVQTIFFSLLFTKVNFIIILVEERKKKKSRNGKIREGFFFPEKKVINSYLVLSYKHTIMNTTKISTIHICCFVFSSVNNNLAEFWNVGRSYPGVMLLLSCEKKGSRGVRENPNFRIVFSILLSFISFQ